MVSKIASPWPHPYAFHIQEMHNLYQLDEQKRERSIINEFASRLIQITKIKRT